ncbi:g-strand binding protein [Savitreella phatthalungensis]
MSARDGRSRYSGGGGAADDAPYDRYQAGSRGRSRSPGVDARRYSSGRRDDDRYYDAGNSRPRSRSPLRRGGAGGDVDMPDGDFRRVYVGNLSYDTKWTHLKDLMREGKSPLPWTLISQY